MGKLDQVRTECGFRRISMAISDDKTGRCGVRGKSGGVLEAAARRTIFALETEAQDEMDDEGGGRVFVSLECKDGNEIGRAHV